MTEDLDSIFKALADPTRRAQLARLTKGPATIRELSDPFDMTLPAASKHVKILEAAGLLRCEKVGRSHVCTLSPRHLSLLDDWLGAYRPFWNGKLNDLAAFVDQTPRDKND